MSKTLFCLSPYQAWSYHTDCDIKTIESISKGFKPDKLLLITCSGGLDYCDLRNNIQLATGCSNKSACEQCCRNKKSYLDKIKYIAIKSNIKYENIEIELKREDKKPNIGKREYYLSELCSYYRLDELNLEKVNLDENKIAIKLAIQSRSLQKFYEEIIDESEHNFGITFNGRLSPYSDLVNWCNNKSINVIVHERGKMDGLMNIRLNRKALDQQEFNYLIDEYMKIWEPSDYPKITRMITDEYLGKGNLTSRIWKDISKRKNTYSKQYQSNSIKPNVAIFLSSTDEAYNDDGTLLLEMQMLMLDKLIELKKEGYIEKIIVKPHPDSISRIDLTIQQSIVTTLIKHEKHIQTCWPESTRTMETITTEANIIIVPHSSVAIELASKNIQFITFQDSPFKKIAERVIGVGEITDKHLLKVIINKQMARRAEEPNKVDSSIDKFGKLELSWLLWDSVINQNHRLVNSEIDRSMTRSGIKTLINIGKLECIRRLNICSLRQEFIEQAKVNNRLFKAHELMVNTIERSEETESFKQEDRYKIDYTANIYGISVDVELIESKWRNVPKELKEGMMSGVMLINGLYMYKDFLAILYGWNIPEKAKRSWELVETQDIKELTPMCLTMNKDIATKVEEIWCRWQNKKASNWDTIYQTETFKAILRRDRIKCYSYREPLILSKGS